MARVVVHIFNWTSYLFLLAIFAFSATARHTLWGRDSSHIAIPDGTDFATRWAILIAGSYGYGNYRHQADVCHAYHVLRNGGLKEENIVVFMFDDIADNPANPHPGTIINRPDGENVYAGVPKDYTGSEVTVDNVLAAFLGNKSGVTGGSGKLIDSGPEDHIFMFYSDHGGPGVLGMPANPNLFANDLVAAFRKKHDAGGYKEMVVYLEACESGSIFEGLLTDNLDVYATTASNAEESSWGTYCPGMVPPPPPEYLTCLGDLYSVSWMEDSETHNLKEETLQEQYEIVKSRTSNYNTYTSGSHVMRYGKLQMGKEKLYAYIGSDLVNENLDLSILESLEASLLENFDKSLDELLLPSHILPSHLFNSQKGASKGTTQRDAELLYLWLKYTTAPDGSNSKTSAQDELVKALAHRIHIDRSVRLMGELLFGKDEAAVILEARRPAGQPLVDDWDCLKAMVQAFEAHCGTLTPYGLKHTRSFANICNVRVNKERMEAALFEVCSRSNVES